MFLQLKHNFIAWSAILLLYLYLSSAMETTTMSDSEDDDSSSEETVEDSNEEARSRRSAEIPDGSDVNNISPKEPRLGLPDPATILRIAEILQTVGEKVIPILVQGNAFVTERIGQEFKFLNKFKKDIEQFTESTMKNIQKT